MDPRLILCLASGLISAVAAFQFLAALRRILWKPPPIVKGSGRATTISVMIPARNEEQDLAQALASILAQQDVELEAIVVNDHSTDRTGAIADAAADGIGNVDATKARRPASRPRSSVRSSTR